MDECFAAARRSLVSALSFPRSTMATASRRANIRTMLRATKPITASGIGMANQSGARFIGFNSTPRGL